MINKKSQIPKQTKQRKLLRAAADVFARSGFDAASTREIADQAGVNMALISYHFGGKEGLYEAVLADWMDGLRARIESAIQDVPDPNAKIAALVIAFLRFALFEAPGFAAVVARESILAEPSPTTKLTTAALAPVCELLVTVLAASDSALTEGVQCIAFLLRLSAPMPSIERDTTPEERFEHARQCALTILLQSAAPSEGVALLSTPDRATYTLRPPPTMDFVD